MGFLSTYLARRRDLRAIQATVRVYEENVRAGWDELDAFAAAVAVGERFGMSSAARNYLATNPPLARVIEEHREQVTVKSFMDDGPHFYFP
jgi:hypothetical protein